MKKIALIISVLSLFLHSIILAENLKLSGYAEGYYGIYSPSDVHRYSSAVYHFNQVNEANINHALLSAAYSDDRYRANIGIHAGTYVDTNYVAEPDFWKSIFQANLGVKLSNHWWLDAGIFPSHIGFESAIGKDNWNLTRSLMAENSPYFETGIKVTYSASDDFSFSGMVLNGWQNISDTNLSKAFGTQLTFKPNSTLLFNYSTFIGNESPDNSSQTRYFNNFYVQFSLSPQLSLATLFDFGLQKQTGMDETSWYALALLGKYKINDKWQLGSRIEHYSDADQVIVATNTNHGFQTSGVAFNMDYVITDYLVFRTEAKYLHSKDDVFFTESGMKNNAFIVMSSAVMTF